MDETRLPKTTMAELHNDKKIHTRRGTDTKTIINASEHDSSNKSQ
jgi:hypothetical protein